MKVKQVLIIIFALVIASFIGYNFGITQTGSFKSIIEPQAEHHSPPSVVIEPGSAVETASYIIFHDDETPKNYYAKSGDTGEIEYQDTNAANVINWAINQLTNGGLIFIKNGNYSLTQPIVISYDYITLVGESQSAIIRGTATELIKLESGVGVTTIKNLRISGADGATYGISSRDLIGSDHISHLTLSHCKITTFTGEGEYGMIIANWENSLFENNKFFNSPILFAENGYGSGNTELRHNVFATNKNNTIFVTFFTNGTKNIGQHYFHYNHFYNHQTGQLSTGYLLNSSVSGQKIHGFVIDSDRFEKISRAIDTVTAEGATIVNLQVISSEFLSKKTATYETAVWLDSRTTGARIIGNHFSGHSEDGDTGIRDLNSANPPYNQIYNNVFESTVTIPINATSATIIRNNLGYTTENSGVASSITDGAWVEHNLASTPNIVTLTPRSNAVVWVNSRNETHFQIGVSTGTVTVDWYAEV